MGWGGVVPSGPSLTLCEKGQGGMGHSGLTGGAIKNPRNGHRGTGSSWDGQTRRTEGIGQRL